jgi:hypothetical protein
MMIHVRDAISEVLDRVTLADMIAMGVSSAERTPRNLARS